MDVTRGRQHNLLYATRREDNLDGERLPKAPPPPLDATIAAQLAKSGEITAWQLASAKQRTIGRESPPASHELSL